MWYLLFRDPDPTTPRTRSLLLPLSPFTHSQLGHCSVVPETLMTQCEKKHRNRFAATEDEERKSRTVLMFFSLAED